MNPHVTTSGAVDDRYEELIDSNYKVENQNYVYFGNLSFDIPQTVKLDDDRVFHLEAVIFHSGNMITSGHYTAAVMWNQEWWYYNDADVRPLNNTNLVKKYGEKKHFNPVILLYVDRSNKKAPSVRGGSDNADLHSPFVASLYAARAAWKARGGSPVLDLAGSSTAYLIAYTSGVFSASQVERGVLLVSLSWVLMLIIGFVLRAEGLKKIRVITQISILGGFGAASILWPAPS